MLFDGWRSCRGPAHILLGSNLRQGLFRKSPSVSARSPVCDGSVCEGRSVSSRQDSLQEDLGGAASLHPGRAADGFWLNVQTHQGSKYGRHSFALVVVCVLTPTAGLMMKAF